MLIACLQNMNKCPFYYLLILQKIDTLPITLPNFKVLKC